jgi:ligand-binding sensor domain-containing protein
MQPVALSGSRRLLYLAAALCFSLASFQSTGAREGPPAKPSRPVPPLAIDIKAYTKHTSGLPYNLVEALLPLPDGSVWVGTSAGLAHFHQGQWQVYTTKNSKLPRQRVFSMAAQPDGVVWVGTEGGGLVRIAQGKWQVFTQENSGLPGNDINSLALGTDGALWVSSCQHHEEKRADGTTVRRVGFEKSYVSRLKDGTWKVFAPVKDLGFRVVTSGTALRVTPDGTVWAMNSYELSRFQRGNWKRQAVGLSEHLLDQQVQKLNLHERFKGAVTTKDGILWVGTTVGLARYTEGSWQFFTTENSGLPDNKIEKLASTPDGALWVGTEKSGLARFYRGRWEIFTSENSGLPDNHIRTLAATTDGALWAGTAGGLACYYRGLWGVSKNSGLPDIVYRRVAKGTDGSLWIGTTDNGLIRVKRSPWEIFTRENSGLPDNRVGALVFSPDGTLWVATEKSGLTRLHGRQWQSFTSENSGLPNNEVNALACTSDGALWAKSPAGITRFFQGQWQTFTEQDCKPLAHWYGTLAATPDGALWVGTGGGLARYYQGKWRVLTPENSPLPFTGGVEQLAVSPEGALWVRGTIFQRSPPGVTYSLARLSQGLWQVYPPKQWLPFADGGMAVTAGGDVWLGAVWRFSQGQYELFGPYNSGLPHRFIEDLKVSLDGALWAATHGGLARYHEGHWQTFTPKNSGIPEKTAWRLAPAPDGAIWAGTIGGGLVRFQPPTVRPRLIYLIPGGAEKTAKFAEARLTFAAQAFDPTYHTDPRMFRYAWVIRQRGQTTAKPEGITDTAFFFHEFEDGQEYTLDVQAIDGYGYRSAHKKVHFLIKVPKPAPEWQQWLKELGIFTGLLSLAYLLFLPPLILLYTGSSLARTAVNSGMFTKFPLIHKTVLNSNWARRRLFRAGAHKYLQDLNLPRPYIPQAVYRTDDKEGQPIQLQEVDDFLCRLCTPSSHALLLGRSGTGKSILLRYLLQQALERFLSGATGELPLLIDLRTQPLGGRQLEDVIADELKGHGVELPDDMLRFWLKKGGFLLLVDSLNEVDSKVIKNDLQAFLNRDFHNRIIMASQLDNLERRDVQVLQLAEVSGEQARKYLEEVLGRDLWERLPVEVQGLARNPQDLTLLGGVLQAAPPEEVPTHRAELYAKLVQEDTALSVWMKTDSVEIRVIYKLAFRMVEEGRRVLNEDDLTGWVRQMLEEQEVTGAESVAAIVQGVQRSRMFRQEKERLPLGLTRPVMSFGHELLGKFLASRHLRDLLSDPATPAWEEVLNLSGEPRWLEVCYFALDELPPGGRVMERFLQDLLQNGGALRLRLVAYALGTRPPEAISQEVWEAYNQSKIAEDLRETPANIAPAIK